MPCPFPHATLFTVVLLSAFTWLQGSRDALRSSCSALDGACSGMAQEDVLLQSRFEVRTEATLSVVEGLAAAEDEEPWDSEHPLWNHEQEHVEESKADAEWNRWAEEENGEEHGSKCANHSDDWMYETTLDHEWIAGGDPDDTEYLHLSDAEKPAFVKEAHKVSDEILTEGGNEAAQDRKAWVQLFQTEHQRAVRTLEKRPYMGRVGQKPCSRYEGAGSIAGLYTFGAPGTALVPLNNVLAADGKFPGLRMVTQRLKPVRKIIRRFHDPVPFFAGIVGYKHPRMDLLVVNDGEDAEHHPVSHKVVRRPRSDMGFWIEGHFQPMYYKVFAPHKDKFDATAWTMLHMSKAVSPGMNNYSRVGNAAWAAKVGWNLVAQSKNEKLRRVDLVYLDNTSLFQDPITKACTLAFVGTHHLSQWLVNLRFRPARFCGIPNVHMGFRNQLRRAIRSKQWNEEMLPALAACPKLFITGHSLGAAQAQLVAACMQRAPAPWKPGWEDYKHLVWTPRPEAARLLPPLVSAEEIAKLGNVSL